MFSNSVRRWIFSSVILSKSASAVGREYTMDTQETPRHTLMTFFLAERFPDVTNTLATKLLAELAGDGAIIARVETRSKEVKIQVQRPFDLDQRKQALANLNESEDE